MSETANEEKIEQLVHAVLEAVDARLAEVRAEVRQVAATAARQHSELSQKVGALQEQIQRQPVEPGGDHAGAIAPSHLELATRMEQATQVLLERIEAMNQRTAMVNNEHFTRYDAEIEALRTAIGVQAQTFAAALATVPAAAPGDQASSHEQRTAATDTGSTPMLAPMSGAVAGSVHQEIDVDQLTELLSARLGQLSLPPLS